MQFTYVWPRHPRQRRKREEPAAHTRACMEALCVTRIEGASCVNLLVMNACVSLLTASFCTVVVLVPPGRRFDGQSFYGDRARPPGPDIFYGAP
jgi:hypothetical protein